MKVSGTSLYLLIAGGRDFDDYGLLERTIKETEELKKDEIVIISGMARGADSLGAKWGKENCGAVLEFPADWKKHGKQAGILRNMEMVDFIEEKRSRFALFFWDGKSRGTKHCIDYCTKKGVPLKIVEYVNGS